MIRQEARASGASTTISCRAGRGAEKNTLLFQARAGPVCRILWYESSFKTSISDKQKLNELNERANATAEIHDNAGIAFVQLKQTEAHFPLNGAIFIKIKKNVICDMNQGHNDILWKFLKGFIIYKISYFP